MPPLRASEPWHFEPKDTEPVSYLADLDRTLNGIRTKTCQGLVVLDPKEREPMMRPMLKQRNAFYSTPLRQQMKACQVV
ncbi:BQ5605_C018g08781 [Microbotryum silenes-dioicae]|uniref:BQ5605_C018g08781 protein n=1 Tax=Microbotryum silenes-dioicae TaxID=796604 RepID=A0A2X0NUT3_9BASI|nr:BQ5605_C018g08781 [Microbotryum silenes-dioicae]